LIQLKLKLLVAYFTTYNPCKNCQTNLEVIILPTKKTKKKKNVFNDGVKNAENNENIGERLNMPAGSRQCH